MLSPFIISVIPITGLAPSLIIRLVKSLAGEKILPGTPRKAS